MVFFSIFTVACLQLPWQVMDFAPVEALAAEAYKQ